MSKNCRNTSGADSPLSLSFSALVSMLSWMSCASTVHGSDVDELRSTPGDGSFKFAPSIFWPRFQAVQLGDDGVRAVPIELDELEGTGSGGGVMHLHGCDAK
jgi:hypothetical protein